MVDLAAGTKVKNVFDPEPVINQLSGMKICEIAQFIINDWSKQGRVPKTYLEAMLKIESLDDMYGADPASSVVSYFIVNASQWKGDIAKVTKKYLSELLKKYNAQVK
jgi:hypothetical protein